MSADSKGRPRVAVDNFVEPEGEMKKNCIREGKMMVDKTDRYSHNTSSNFPLELPAMLIGHSEMKRGLISS